MRIKPCQEIIIAGDLNARVGSQENSRVVGRYGEEVVNDSGLRLIELCELNCLRMLNSFYPHKLIHRYTRERPSLQQKSNIDYVITRQRSNFKIHNCRVKRGANYGSDHRLVSAVFVFPFVVGRHPAQAVSERQTQHLIDDEDC